MSTTGKAVNDEVVLFWNDRYSQVQYAYGEEPNEFFKEKLKKVSPGRILFAAEGEGRNAVFAATLGWQVDAFDISVEGKKKADALALKNQTKIDYQVGELSELHYPENSFDAIVLIYAHVAPETRTAFHARLNELLKIGGLIVFEGFSKKHPEYQAVNPQVGGPRDFASLFSLEEIKADFKNYNFIQLTEQSVELKEGKFHIGTGSVIRFVGKKTS